MKPLSSEDLSCFKQAILADYGLSLEGCELHQAAWLLLQYVETLIKFEKDRPGNKNDKKVLKSST